VAAPSGAKARARGDGATSRADASLRSHRERQPAPAVESLSPSPSELADEPQKENPWLAMGQRLERTPWSTVGEDPSRGPSLAEAQELEHDARLEELLRHAPVQAPH
jgi:hypothetical protein